MDNIVLYIQELGTKAVWIYLVFLAVMSFVTFMTYGIDKLKAIRDQWRISEKALLSLTFFGGAIGGLLAMRFLRHKTKHWYFWFLNGFCTLLQAAVFVWILLII